MTDQSGLPPNYKREGLLGVYTIGSYHLSAGFVFFACVSDLHNLQAINKMSILK